MENRYFKFVFTGFLAGNILAVIFSQWIFLEMRVNINIVIPLSMLAALSISYFSSIKLQSVMIFTSEIIFGLLLFFLYDFNSETYLVIPASMFREGFFLQFLSLGVINTILVFIFLIANFFIFRDLKSSVSLFAGQTDES